jgi:predicted esterase
MATRLNRTTSSTPPTKAILCLHGSGASSAIFRLQLARLRLALKTRFEFIFVDAPNPATAGPGILPLFAGAGPFWRWFELEGGQREAEIRRIHDKIRAAIDLWTVSRKSPQADIVGLMAFSQGAIAATMLLWQKQQGLLPWFPTINFAILICCDFAEELSEHMHGSSGDEGQAVLKLPTLHLHGRSDPFLKKGRKMVETHFDPSRSDILEFDGGHQCPNTQLDCAEATRRILRLSQSISEVSTPTTRKLDVDGKAASVVSCVSLDNCHIDMEA